MRIVLDLSASWNWWVVLKEDAFMDLPLNAHECKGHITVTQDAVGCRRISFASRIGGSPEILFAPHEMTVLFYIADANGVKFVDCEKWESSELPKSDGILVYN